MGVYAVRLIDGKEAVGVFYVERLADLFWAVDECTGPHTCEYRRLPPGGVFWAAPGARVWAEGAEEHEVEDVEYDVPSTTSSWHEALFGPGKWKRVVP
jgi:hypothetical protein